MAARDAQHSNRAGAAQRECLSSVELAGRLDEEVHRAARQGTLLGCLLVSLEEIEHLSQTYGEDLPAQALAYIATALIRQLRRFDRVGRVSESELLVILPGADERRAEIVARRALGRLHSVKVEVEGRRETAAHLGRDRRLARRAAGRATRLRKHDSRRRDAPSRTNRRASSSEGRRTARGSCR